MASWFKRGEKYYLRFFNIEKNAWDQKSMGRRVAADLEADAIVAKQNLIEINRKSGADVPKKIIPSVLLEELKRYRDIELLKSTDDGIKKSAGTIHRYQKALNSFVHHVIENEYKTFEEITEETMKSFYLKKAADYANTTSIILRLVLVGFFKWSISQNFIFKNPMENIRGPKVEQNNEIPFFYSFSQTQQILEKANDIYKPVLSFLYLTGMRIGELCGTEYSFIREIENPDKKTMRTIIQLPKKRDGFKTKRGRTVWLNQEAITIINEQRKAALKINTPDSRKYIFWNRDGRQLKDRKVRQHLDRIASECNICGERLLHAWRHTFASHLVMRGEYLQTVMKLLGHTNIQQTMRYADLAPEFVQSAVDKNIYLPGSNPSVNIREFKAKGAA